MLYLICWCLSFHVLFFDIQNITLSPYCFASVCRGEHLVQTYTHTHRQTYIIQKHIDTLFTIDTQTHREAPRDPDTQTHTHHTATHPHIQACRRDRGLPVQVCRFYTGGGVLVDLQAHLYIRTPRRQTDTHNHTHRQAYMHAETYKHMSVWYDEFSFQLKPFQATAPESPSACWRAALC